MHRISWKFKNLISKLKKALIQLNTCFKYLNLNVLYNLQSYYNIYIDTCTNEQLID